MQDMNLIIIFLRKNLNKAFYHLFVKAPPLWGFLYDGLVKLA